MGEEIPLRRSERLQELEQKNKENNMTKSREFVYIFDEMDSEIAGTGRKRGRDRKQPSLKSLPAYSGMKDRRIFDAGPRFRIGNTGNQEEERRLTYRPPTIPILGLASEKRGIHINTQVPYRESLMRFAKEAGPEAEAHAQKYYEHCQAKFLEVQQQIHRQQMQEQFHHHGLLRETSQVVMPMSSESMGSLAPQNLSSNANSSTSAFPQMPQQGISNMLFYGNPSTIMSSPEQNINNMGSVISTSALFKTSISTNPFPKESFTYLLLSDTLPSAFSLEHQNYPNMSVSSSTAISPLPHQNYCNMSVSSSPSTYPLVHHTNANIFTNPSTSTYPLAHTNYNMLVKSSTSTYPSAQTIFSDMLVNPSASTFPATHQNYSNMVMAHENCSNILVNASTSTHPLAHPIYANTMVNPSTSTKSFAHPNHNMIPPTSIYAMQQQETSFKNMLVDHCPNTTTDTNVGASSSKGKNVIIESPTKLSGLKIISCNDGVRFNPGTSNATTFSVRPSLDLNLSIGSVDLHAEQKTEVALGKLQPTEGHDKGCQFLTIGIGPSNVDESFEGNFQMGQS